MAAIVRVAIVAITLALLAGSALNALNGYRDLSVVFALAAPLGISAWGFARGGHHEAALVLLCVVLTVVTTMVLVLSPYGARDVAITAYGGIVLTGALLLSRRAFYALAGLTLFAGCAAFIVDILGFSHARPGHTTDWAQLVEFIVIIGVFAALGRYASEVLMGSLGDAQRANHLDSLTGLPNRAGFLAAAGARMKGPLAGNSVLVLADLDNFRRVNIVIGHRAGDAVLEETARRLRDAMSGHMVARVGDDEFVVLGHGIGDDAQCDAFARAVHRALQFEYSGVSVRASVGYARAPRDANGLEALMLAAEASLINAKDHEHEADRFAAPAERI